MNIDSTVYIIELIGRKRGFLYKVCTGYKGMDIEMSDYPILLAKLRKYFPKLIVQSYENDNANSDVSKVNLEVSKYTLQDGWGHTLTPHRLKGKAQLSIFMEGMLSVLDPESENKRKGKKEDKTIKKRDSV